ncbi:MAG TPA: ATP-binding protein [Lacisediminihabitans sp.]|nr:ATP-binding protein [Lacisediminihabitans sp.]HXD61089.1 ATP-binding protein [Lacisediminihabitans sp.]
MRDSTAPAAPQTVPADVDVLVGLIAASADRPVVLLDGRSGSGKTTLALALVAAYPGVVSLIRLDDIYPGWDGLRAASDHLRDNVLGPLADGREPRWQRWDWVTDAPAEWHSIDPGRPVLIEGCGALSRSNRALAGFALWVELDAQERKRRALARDGDAYRPFWDRWAAQERGFIAREHPQSLANLIVDGRTVVGA